ncbi:hypothetical protein GCM10010971_14020 [Silvimonas amylolytica]|uniref:3'-phosphate/5'-hydroxy nucleic acid ligase n=1 Tax=Silvimonas amylolytica TaxID=449663 RepID=A0ABQ2PJQ4_9NEIS|nr:hypothetical protein GCM10010971_14020 [Silvimonas amylolytica]
MLKVAASAGQTVAGRRFKHAIAGLPPSSDAVQHVNFDSDRLPLYTGLNAALEDVWDIRNKLSARPMATVKP